MSDLRNYDNRVNTVQIDELLLIHRSGVLDLFQANALVEFLIYEDIYSNSMTGSIMILDNAGWFEKFPICGDEQLKIRFKTAEEFPGPYFEKTFHIYKCDGLTTANGSRSRSYNLLFCSKSMVDNTQKKIRRSWVNTRESAIVSDICTNMLGIKCAAEETRFPRTIVVPAWRPFQTINYLANTSVRSKGYPASNYLFFETSKGHNFCSMDFLMEKPYAIEMDFHVSRASEKRETAKIWNVRDFKVISTFDNFKRANNGMFAHRFIAQDIINKKIKNFDYLYAAEHGGQIHTDPGAAKLMEKFSSDLDQRVSFGPWQKKYNSEHADDWMRRRMPMMEQLGGYAIECTTEGNTNATVGMKVKFNLVSNKSDSEEEDKRLSGEYIITRIMHSVNNKEHNQVVEIRKSALYS